MWHSAVLALLVCPLVAFSQSTTSPTVTSSVSGQSGTQPAPTQSGNATTNVILSTSLSTGVILGSGRVPTTITTGIVYTITPSPTQSTTNGTNPSNNSSSSSSSSTSTGPLPTAPTDIDTGGNSGPNGAPMPGASAPDGRYGPPDNYTAAAIMLHINTFLAVVAAMGVGGALVLV